MRKKFFMIDLDGTMYRGTQRIEGAKTFIDTLIRERIPFLFLTNNASRTQQQICNHMQKMGFKDIKPEQFYTSAMAAAEKIARDFPSKKSAYYVGETGLKEALISNGFNITFKNVDFLFIGLDRQANFQDYSYALRAVGENTELVATNDDRIFLSEEGVNIGNGSVVAMFEYAMNKKSIKIGKPYSPIIEGALRYAKVNKEDVMLIGDNLETDILCGIQSGIETTFVTTGVHDMEDCYRLNIHPTYILATLDGLLK